MFGLCTTYGGAGSPQLRLISLTSIACLGWGSLIWAQGDLPTRSGWSEDGPLVRVEFARQSQCDRITLVMVPCGPQVRSLWVLMDTECLEVAAECLRKREKTAPKYIDRWFRGERSPDSIPELAEWADARGLDGVVWTALPPKFHGETGKMPTDDDVVKHLQGLPCVPRERAEQYIRKAPRQIDTPYRRRIEAELHWDPEH